MLSTYMYIIDERFEKELIVNIKQRILTNSTLGLHFHLFSINGRQIMMWLHMKQNPNAIEIFDPIR